MSTLLVLGYWLLAAMVVFPYIGYPLTLWLLIRLRGPYRPVESGDHLPGVSLIISAFNEAAVLDAKLNNARALDYPTDKLQIVVISDASDDGTDDIVLKHAAQDPRVVLHRQEERRGKTAGLNHGIEKSQWRSRGVLRCQRHVRSGGGTRTGRATGRPQSRIRGRRRALQ
ncbi:MAG: glycosyltransferase [Proteobacteria bacterium]|nr:glycosyltransferase [Pseudomonadota bacterium]